MDNNCFNEASDTNSGYCTSDDIDEIDSTNRRSNVDESYDFQAIDDVETNQLKK